jgi:DNA-binding protein
MAKAVLKKVPLRNKEVIVLHDCTKEDVIDQLKGKVDILSIILTGNGDPEKGIARKVAIIGERQGEVLKKIDDVHITLKGYHEEVNEAKDVAKTVSNAFEKYKAEIEGKEIGTEKTIKEKREDFLKTLQTIGIIIAAITLCITAYFSVYGSTQSVINSKKLDNFGTPVIINSRGMPTALPNGDSLKFYRDGEYKDTMR